MPRIGAPRGRPPKLPASLETGFRIDYVGNRLEIGPVEYGWNTPWTVTIPTNVNTVAIAHVHPINGISSPSTIDLTKIVYPDYVITKDGLYATYPGTGRWRYVRSFAQEFHDRQLRDTEVMGLAQGPNEPLADRRRDRCCACRAVARFPVGRPALRCPR